VVAAPFRQPVNGDVVVSAYFDHGGRDWNCGDNTYGGHKGTDLAIIGRFAAQDEGRDVAAAQGGRVSRAHDGEFDRCTTADCGGGGGYGNHVFIEHPDGQVTIYAHLRQGSVRVAEGQDVACGQVIGQVGSSGYSTGPHLHFEVKNNGASDDPFSGPCGGPLNWWVDQGAYNALPSDQCGDGPVEPPPPPPPPPPPSKPDLHLALSVEAAAARDCGAEDCRDFNREGRSAGVFDAWVGEALVARLVVSNQGPGGTLAERPEDAAVEVQYSVPPGLRLDAYTIESDWPSADRQTWARNDAQDNPANPPADAPPPEGVLRLNGFSPGESKRVVLALTASAPTPASEHAALRTWVRHIGGYYGERTAWDDPVETNDGQSFNGGDLRLAFELDVFAAPATDDADPDAGRVTPGPAAELDGSVEPPLTLDAGPSAEAGTSATGAAFSGGGCSAAPGRVSTPGAALAALALALGTSRRRWGAGARMRQSRHTRSGA